MENRYPRLEVNLEHLRHNVVNIVEKCGAHGIQIAGVIKGATGLPEVAKAYDEGGAAMIASSRLEQLQAAKDAGIEKPLMLIRIPMLSEVKEVVKLTDISLNSEMEVIKALNQAAREEGKLHKVILMADLGDLREGFWEKDELIEACEYIENKMINVQLVGIGTNLGCYGSVMATVEKLEELCELAEAVEAKLGRELEYVAGGATSSLTRIWDHDIPKKINLLRIGEGILTALDMGRFYGYDISELYQDVFKLKAEVIEVKNKPTHPVGTITIDAFGQTPEYVDRGIRRRALLGVGRVDYGHWEDLICCEEGVEVIGASSDHTIVDVEDAVKDYKVGDIMEFEICYSTLVYVTSSDNVNIVFV